jgi:alpha-L-fucosidase 2
VFLLPALPDVWPSGSVRGLRAIGGFEIVEMHWKDARVEKVVIKSTLGGNLRLRVPNEIKLDNDRSLTQAKGENTNPMYQVAKITSPVVSSKATVARLQLKSTWMYDVATETGKSYTFVNAGASKVKR